VLDRARGIERVAQTTQRPDGLLGPVEVRAGRRDPVRKAFRTRGDRRRPTVQFLSGLLLTPIFLVQPRQCVLVLHGGIQAHQLGVPVPAGPRERRRIESSRRAVVSGPGGRESVPCLRPDGRESVPGRVHACGCRIALLLRLDSGTLGPTSLLRAAGRVPLARRLLALRQTGLMTGYG